MCHSWRCGESGGRGSRTEGSFIPGVMAFRCLFSGEIIMCLALSISPTCPRLQRTLGLQLLEWGKRAGMLPVCLSALSGYCGTFLFSLKGIKHHNGAHTGLIWVIFQGFLVVVAMPLWHKWIPIMLLWFAFEPEFHTVEEITVLYHAHSNSSMQLVETRTLWTQFREVT